VEGGRVRGAVMLVFALQKLSSVTMMQSIKKKVLSNRLHPLLVPHSLAHSLILHGVAACV
jgi:hypothetical protein